MRTLTASELSQLSIIDELHWKSEDSDESYTTKQAIVYAKNKFSESDKCSRVRFTLTDTEPSVLLLFWHDDTVSVTEEDYIYLEKEGYIFDTSKYVFKKGEKYEEKDVREYLEYLFNSHVRASEMPEPHKDYSYIGMGIAYAIDGDNEISFASIKATFMFPVVYFKSNKTKVWYTLHLSTLSKELSDFMCGK